MKYKVSGSTVTKETHGYKSILHLPFDAWCVHVDVLDKHPKIRTVVVSDEFRGRFRLPVEVVRTFHIVNRGFGDQYAVPLEKWEKVEAEDEQR